MQTLDNLIEQYTPIVLEYGVALLVAVLILVVGRIVAKKSTKVFIKMLEKQKLDKAVSSFLSSILYALIMIAVALMALSQLGIETTSFIAILGAAGLAIGLALKDSLANFASGVMIILFRPFRSGDYVEAGGVAGSIETIEIFATTIKTPDNKIIIVPNSAITSDSIINYSKQPTRRIDLVIGVSYDANLKEAKEVLQRVISADSRILAEPDTTIAVSELADSSVNFVVRPWVKTEDYWPVYFDLIENIKVSLDEAKIGIPYPQMDIHISKPN